MELYATQVVLFFLLFLRCSSLVAIAPVLGHLSVPVQVKVALSGFMAFVLYPLIAAQGPVVDMHLLALAVVAVQEVITGLAIGFAAGLIFAGVRAGGEMIGFDLGLSLANAFDPESGPNNIIGGFLYLMMLLVFFLVNGHHFVLQALVVSYEAIPVNGLVIGGAAAERLVALTGTVFIVAVKCAAPVLVASFLINVALALLARVAPQIHVFIISFPVKIGLGLLVLMATGPFLVYAFKTLLAGFEENLLQLIRVM